MHEWMDEASCKGVDPDKSSYPDGVKTEEYRDILLSFARDYCDHCPVSFQCLKTAKPDDRRYTVRAGILPGERAHTSSAGKRIFTSSITEARQDPNSLETRSAVLKFLEKGVCRNGHVLTEDSVRLSISSPRGSQTIWYLTPRCGKCQNVSSTARRKRARMAA